MQQIGLVQERLIHLIEPKVEVCHMVIEKKARLSLLKLHEDDARIPLIIVENVPRVNVLLPKSLD
jgi:hypothetical protein